LGQTIYQGRSGKEGGKEMKVYQEISESIEKSTDKELVELIKLCAGRVLTLGSRPTQSGDAERYDQCSWLVKLAGQALQDRGVLQYNPINGGLVLAL
jgi:hypothetical protein